MVGIAATSRGWSVYVDAVEDGSYLPERAADRLGRVAVGRSCIRLRTAEDVDLEVLAELVGRAARLRSPELTG